MPHLYDNSYLESSKPNSIATYKRRQFLKILTRIGLLSIVVAVCFYFGRRVHWNVLSENYKFDPRDVDFVQYFCTNNQQPPNAGISKSQSLNSNAVEHVKADYLKHEILPDTAIPLNVWDNLPVRGAYYMVVRNEKLADVRAVIKSMQDHMVNGTRYPWVLLNNQHFTAEFRNNIKKLATSQVFFGKIDLETWEYPYWIDIPRAEYMMLEQERSGIYNGARLSYHQLLRYHSGFFFHHPLLKDVEYTWRVEPGSDYSCEMNDDMFLHMKNNKKSLGFVLTMKEAPFSIRTLWQRTNEFVELHPEYVLPANSTVLPWIYNAKESNYNYCHFWTNFQIADLSFFRSEAYQKFFEYLDRTGNFFYERWGDAPVQTIAAALFLKREQIHFFNNIGYEHSVAAHCPLDETMLTKCSCDIHTSYDFHEGSCTRELLELIDVNYVAKMIQFSHSKEIYLSEDLAEPLPFK